MADIPFRNLRVAGVRALKECQLLRLGRVNVFCGRNNSGKSTLLEGVISKDKRFPGLVLDDSHIEPLVGVLYQSGGWAKAHSPASTGEWQVIRSIVTEALGPPRLMFLSEAPVLARDIQERFARSRLRQWAFSSDGVAGLFRQWMPSDHSSVLVSPKRQLDTSKGVSASEEITPVGFGVLNFLFFAKNQPTTSPERTTYEQIASAFTTISNGYLFDVFISRSNELDLRFAKGAASWVHATDCGLGLQDLLVLLYFIVAPGLVVVAIEEPESHMHPDMQRRLLGYIHERSDRQFFISTHSNVFLNNVFVDRVYFTTYQGEVRVDDATGRASMLDDLGYSVADNLVTDVVILVEGPTDTPVVEELLLKKGILPRFDVKTWPLGGDIMDQVDLALLTQTYQVIALLDRDPGSSKVRKRFRERCAEANIPVVQLKRYAIENYFTLGALRAVLGAQIPPQLNELAPNASLESQIGINVKKNNRRIARELALADVENTDLGAFLNIVSDLCERSATARATV
jgi:5S rRNA maturation endonuclease (ribonuclease M5)